MDNNIQRGKGDFIAIQVQSPMALGEEPKDQDRLYWFNPMATAAISDGVTTSPFCAAGAEYSVQFSPVLFKNEKYLKSNLRALADWLIVKRLEAQRKPIKLSENTPPNMEAVMQEVAQQKMAKSYQATLVAVAFVPSQDKIATSIVWIGDSALFVFSAAGELLFTTIAPQANSHTPIKLQDVRNIQSRFGFGPEDRILVKVLGTAQTNPSLARKFGIRSTSAGNWLICVPLEPKNQPKSHVKSDRVEPLWLNVNDILLVPKYLTQIPKDPLYRDYRMISYSRAIRTLTQPRISLQDKSHLTAVLPDHFYTHAWHHVRESYPTDAHFVLATDGFYSCFPYPEKMWQWLIKNQATLQHDSRTPLLQKLHQTLHDRQGDDDISFMWITYSDNTQAQSPIQDRNTI